MIKKYERDIFNLVLGAVLAIATTLFFEKIKDGFSFELLAFLAINIFLIAVIVFFIRTNNLVSKSINQQDEIINQLKQSANARIVNANTAHRILGEWVREANKSVEVCSCYLNNWEKNKGNYKKEIAFSDARKSSFNELRKYIEKAKNDKKLEYYRVVQIPCNKNNNEPELDSFSTAVKERDELYSKEFETINKHDSLNRVSIAVAPILWNITFYIIDRKKLVMYFDKATISPNGNNNNEIEFVEPLSMILDSTENSQFEDIQIFFDDLKGHSKVITKYSDFYN